MHGKGVVRRLSLEAAFLPVIDDLPTFVLLISMVRRLLILLLFPLQCLSSLTAPSLRPSLTFSTLQLNYSPPFSPLPHSYAFVSLPKTPPVKSPSPPPPLAHVSSFKYISYIAWLHIKTSTSLEARTGYCCMHT